MMVDHLQDLRQVSCEYCQGGMGVLPRLVELACKVKIAKWLTFITVYIILQLDLIFLPHLCCTH